MPAKRISEREALIVAHGLMAELGNGAETAVTLGWTVAKRMGDETRRWNWIAVYQAMASLAAVEVSSAATN